MSRPICKMCITNSGTFERGMISPGTWYTIDNIIIKWSNGKRTKRYTVCVNGHWRCSQELTLREARAEVARLREEAEQAKYYAMFI